MTSVNPPPLPQHSPPPLMNAPEQPGGASRTHPRTPMSEGVRVRVLRAVHGDPRAAAELAAALSEQQLAGLEPLPAEPVAVAPGLLRSQRRGDQDPPAGHPAAPADRRRRPVPARHARLPARGDRGPAGHRAPRRRRGGRIRPSDVRRSRVPGPLDPYRRLRDRVGRWTGARPIGCSPASCAARARRPAGPGTGPPPRSGPAGGSRGNCAHRRTRPGPRANTRWPALSSNGPPRSPPTRGNAPACWPGPPPTPGAPATPTGPAASPPTATSTG